MRRQEISLALVGKAHLVSLIAQSSVVVFKTSRLNAMLIQPVPQVRSCGAAWPDRKDVLMLPIRSDVRTRARSRRSIRMRRFRGRYDRLLRPARGCSE